MNYQPQLVSWFRISEPSTVSWHVLTSLKILEVLIPKFHEQTWTQFWQSSTYLKIYFNQYAWPSSSHSHAKDVSTFSHSQGTIPGMMLIPSSMWAEKPVDKRKGENLTWMGLRFAHKSPAQICSPNINALSISVYRLMDVSENKGTPKSSILIGCSIINPPFWGTPILGNTHIREIFGRTQFGPELKMGQNLAPHGCWLPEMQILPSHISIDGALDAPRIRFKPGATWLKNMGLTS